ncbi:HNH endonuclease family protein [Nonomuraea antimicrobica]|uniref:HNH endonuclease family protein n=1 Tax=Nonomuraea antimicrobica TaxID=561173 RepID=A0ABP7CT55_9ACTN
MHRDRTLPDALTLACAAALTLTVTAQPATAIPPNIPSASTAASRLASLVVSAESHGSTYDRALFPHWTTVSGSCNTREEVLKRDGTNVVTDSSCAATSGSWYSPYDGATWTAASDVDIDHMVPLAEAWASGAWSWTTARRQQFANDLGGPQLWAVTDNVNQSKSDQDPAEWQPPRSAERCRYARSWIQVKWYWNLTVDSSEKSALNSLLSAC